jgi:uncharacterized repeat protein (TIGR02543 family)
VVVSFDSQGGSVVAAIITPPGSTISPPTDPTRDGHDFGGWFREADCVSRWDFDIDVVSSAMTLYAKWIELTVPENSILSVDIGRIPMRLSPGESFETTVTYTTANGEPPSPLPQLNATVGGESPELISLTASGNSLTILALPMDEGGRRAGGGIYGSAVITASLVQTVSGDTRERSASAVLVIGDELASEIELEEPAEDAFREANEGLAPSEVIILPGNNQTPPGGLPEGWYLVSHLDDADIYILNPDGGKLPECFSPSGKDAADIIIDLRRYVPAGMKGVVPFTYRVTVNQPQMVNLFGEDLAAKILASPMDHLSDIFYILVIQKEIRQGTRAGWFTRLVDGVLTPQRAVEMGILDVTGGNNLTMNLSYWALDDTIEESFEWNGYLIVPDGENDNAIVDPVWLDRWKYRDAQSASGLPPAAVEAAAMRWG